MVGLTHGGALKQGAPDSMRHAAQGWDVLATVRKVQQCGGNLGPEVSSIHLSFFCMLEICYPGLPAALQSCIDSSHAVTPGKEARLRA